MKNVIRGFTLVIVSRGPIEHQKPKKSFRGGAIRIPQKTTR